MERVTQTLKAVIDFWATKSSRHFKSNDNQTFTDTGANRHEDKLANSRVLAFTSVPLHTHTHSSHNQIKEVSVLLLPECCHSNDGVPEGGWDAGEFAGA